tara:strand:+ start:93 stop:959 length:867 start_codon:yes stop_codon:yes gene_type:complete
MVSNPNILPLKQAIKIVRPLNFKTKTEYQNWWTETRPENLARDVIKVYVRSKRKEWPEEKKVELWSYYLGTEIISNQEKNKNWLSYEEASKACRKAGIKSENDFLDRIKKGTLPKGVPTRPYISYKNKGWPNKVFCEKKGVSAWGIFLGTGSIQRGQIKYWPFKKARAYVRKIAKKYNIKNEKPDWRDFTKTDKLPKEIPRNPKREYGQPPWIDWGDWLGTGTISNTKKSQSYLPRKQAKIEARKIVKKLGFRSGQNLRALWKKAYAEGKIPKNLPADLYTYKDTEKK